MHLHSVRVANLVLDFAARLLLRLPLLLLLLLASLLHACGGGGGDIGFKPFPPPSITATVLSSGNYEGYPSYSFPYQYLRIERAGKAAAYALWFPPQGLAADAKAAAVMVTNPYAGIDWTLESVDNEARARATTTACGAASTCPAINDFLLIDDSNNPAYTASNPFFSPYDYSTLEDTVGIVLPYLVNGVGAIVSFERFYAGRSLQDDIDETIAALEFLGTQSSVDTTRLGMWGSSYGGGLAMHAAAQAPDYVKPAYGAMSTPLFDHEQFVPYAALLEQIHSDRARAILRLEPFRTRAVAAATQASGVVDLARYGSATLAANKSTEYLFIADTFDTLAPMLHADTLYFGTPGRHQVLLYPHQGASFDPLVLDLTHNPMQPGYEEGSAIFFSQSYLLVRLASSMAEVLVPRLPYFDPAVFGYFRAQQLLGYDVNTFVVPRLLELSDSRVQLVEYGNPAGPRESGRHFVAGILKTYWQIDVDEASVQAWLQANRL